MNEKMTQEQRLDYPVEEFKTDSVQYKDLETPKDTEEKRRILRSLMNIRMPQKMEEAVLSVQDAYVLLYFYGRIPFPEQAGSRDCRQYCEQLALATSGCYGTGNL